MKIRCALLALSLPLAANLALAPAAFAQSGGAGGTASERPVLRAKPVALDWRKVRFATRNYERVPVDGGAALTLLPDSAARKFLFEILFSTGVYGVPMAQRPALGAAVDMLLEGGAGKRGFDEIQRLLASNGLNLETSLTPDGRFKVSAEGLSADFPLAVALLRDVLLAPRFDPAGLKLWKQDRTDAFTAMLDANNLREQGRYLEQELIRQTLGDSHYFGTFMKRASPKAISGISGEDCKALAQGLIRRNGLEAVLSGTFSAAHRDAALKLLAALPRGEPGVEEWLPERSTRPSGKRIRVAVIRKSDMNQAALQMRFVFPNAGRLNPLEEAHVELLQEVFSATGGVVGNDRFSKALRADSGLSYSAHAHADDELLRPNTNALSWNLGFQSPNDRVAEAVKLAHATWARFLKDGITAEELENARASKMNVLLATEETVFDRARELSRQLLEAKLPPASPIERMLAKLERIRSVEDVNRTLKRLEAGGIVGGLAIMGNPSEKTLAELKRDEAFDVAKNESFENLLKEYL